VAAFHPKRFERQLVTQLLQSPVQARWRLIHDNRLINEIILKPTESGADLR